MAAERGEAVVILDLSLLTAPERCLIYTALNRPEGFSSLHAWAWASESMKPKLQAALHRLSSDTKRRHAIFKRAIGAHGLAWYTLDLAAAEQYVASKRPKGRRHA